MTKARYIDIPESTLCINYPNCNHKGHYVWERNKKNETKKTND